jgi:hypothetical protein
MMVEMALISGVIPQRRRLQISSGSVLLRPDREEADGDFVHGKGESRASPRYDMCSSPLCGHFPFPPFAK